MMKVSCLLLAAGDSTRMQGKNKLMLEIDGKSLIRKTLEEISKINFEQVIVVTGFEPERIMNELRDLPATFIHNTHFETGMHSSIKVGVKAITESSDAFFICLADQPYFSHKNLNLVKKISENDAFQIHVPSFEGQRGHPVLFSKNFISEIIQEPDGDYGLAYLLKRYADKVCEVPVESRDVLIDVDVPSDYQKILTKSYDSTDPVEEFHLEIGKLHTERQIFSIATVIEVIGSSSAKTGSKAIFNQKGKNILGWVGGGCAERFIGEESVKALLERKTRIILADLDDEIFGLGVACGGKMRVFIEPIFPAEIIYLPEATKFQNEIRALSSFYGWNVKKDMNAKTPNSIEDLLLEMVSRISEKRKKSGRSLRLIKEVPAKFSNKTQIHKKEVTIVGRTRITEALARHFTLLSYSVRAIGPDLKPEDYPSNVQCHCLDDSYANINFRSGEVVVIASHTSQDPNLVEKAMKQSASHVAMIGSYKRSLEVLNHLGLKDKIIQEPLYIPAGLDIDANNPDEIALSVVTEIISEQRRTR